METTPTTAKPFTRKQQKSRDKVAFREREAVKSMEATRDELISRAAKLESMNVGLHITLSEKEKDIGALKGRVAELESRTAEDKVKELQAVVADLKNEVKTKDAGALSAANSYSDAIDKIGKEHEQAVSNLRQQVANVLLEGNSSEAAVMTRLKGLILEWDLMPKVADVPETPPA